MLKATTSISETPKKIEVSDVDFEDNSPEEIKLDVLQSKYIFAKVSVAVKISETLNLKL